MSRSRTVPYRWRRGPEALAAMTPPMVARAVSGGSSESHCPRARSAACTASTVMPAWTVAVRSPGSCSSRRARRLRLSTTPLRAGGAPTVAALPPPHGITGTPAAAACWTTVPISSTEPGKTTTSGVQPSTTNGERSIPVRTFAAPRVARSLSSSASTATCRPRSEALGEASLFDGVRTVRHGAGLAAGLLGREHLAGIAEAGRIERHLEPVHEREVGGREDERHEVGFLEPDAVLAGDGAAHL